MDKPRKAKLGLETDNEVSSIVSEINKLFGVNKMVALGETPQVKHPVVKTGSLGVDHILNGGYAQGRIIEIFGENGSGKTTLALHAIAQFQKLGMLAAFIDMEHAFNSEYAETIGVDTKKLLFTQPDFGEEALSIVEKLVESKKVGLIVLDSVAALIPKAELEGEMGEAKMGLHARMMGQAMRKLVGISNKSNTTLLFINQTRFKIGVMFGDPTTTTGGEALKFATSQRIQTIASTKIIKDGEPVGNKVIVKNIKNKIGVPFKRTEFNLIYGKGIDVFGEIVDLIIDSGALKQSGSWFSFNDVKLAQGKENLRLILQDNPELLQEILNLMNID
jgi:recombination protein RecA